MDPQIACAVLRLHRGVARPPLRLLPQHAVRRRVAARAHLRREVNIYLLSSDLLLQQIFNL